MRFLRMVWMFLFGWMFADKSESISGLRKLNPNHAELLFDICHIISLLRERRMATKNAWDRAELKREIRRLKHIVVVSSGGAIRYADSRA